MYRNENGTLKLGKVMTHVILALAILVFVFGSFGTVEVGHIGVKTRLGRVSGELHPGLFIKAPFIDVVHEIDVQVQKEQAEAGAASSDLQTVSATIAVNYNVDGSKASALYSNIGEDYKSRVIDPSIQEATKAATAKYTAEELITKREEVRATILALLKERLSTNYILVDDVSIVHFDFSASFNQAIEAKVTAEQNALAAKNKLDQVKYEADQRVSQATGEAEAIKIQTQAINSQGGVAYTQLKAIEKWDGHLPTQFIPGQSVPFLNLK